MTEGKIEIPPPIGLLDTDSYSAKANRVEISIDPLVFLASAARVASLARAGVISHVPAPVSHLCTIAWRRLKSRARWCLITVS